jgi:hypothetical protein
MDLHDGHLGALRVGVLVECEKARVASFDEVNSPCTRRRSAS